jgi:predicted RND superfamily exporter protein
MRLLITHYWWLVLAVFVTAAGFLFSRADQLEINADVEQLFDNVDPSLERFLENQKVWGADEYAIVCVTRDDWFTPEGIAEAKRIQATLESQVRHTRMVASIGDIPLLRQKDNPTIFGLMGGLKTPFTEGIDLERAKIEVQSHTMAVDNLISQDGKSLSFPVFLNDRYEVELVALENIEDLPTDRKGVAIIAKVGDELHFRSFDAQGQILATKAESDFENPFTWFKTLVEPSWENDPLEGKVKEQISYSLKSVLPSVVVQGKELKRRRQEMVDDLRKLAAEWSQPGAEPVRLSGFPVILANLIEHVEHDLRVFTLASAALFFLALLVIYRNVAFVLGALVTAAVPVMCVVGTMAVSGITMTVITSNLPLLLFVLMLPYSIYLIERFRERRADSTEEVPDSLVGAQRVVFVPCLFSCLTTVAGFAALSLSPIPPVKTFGMMMAIGMAVGLGIVLLFLPSFLRVFGNRIGKAPKAAESAWMRKLVRIFETACLRYRWGVLLASAMVFVVCLLGALRITVEQKFTHYFWESSEVYQGLEYIDQRLGGLMPLEVVLSSEDPDFFTEDAGMAAIESVETFFKPLSATGNLASIRSVRDEARKAFPNMPIHQIFGLIRTAAPEFLQQYLTTNGRTARVMTRMKETDPGLQRLELLEQLDAHLAAQPELKVEGLKVETTGAFVLYGQVLRTLIDSQRQSFLLVLGAILIMLFALFRSPVLPFIVMLPQVLPAVAILGIMGWAGIPLDLVTVMIASIAMGVGVDAAIQYTMRYRAELEATSGDREEALRRAHKTIGRAIWIATSVIVVGFGVLILSDFFPSVWFGVFTGIAMLMSQFAALTTLPSLFLVTGYPRSKAKFVS